MNITKNDITDDVNFIVKTLKKNEVVIPSFLSCAAPGLALMLGMAAWQFFIAFSITPQGKMERLFSLASIGLSIVLGFIIFIAITQVRSKYLSMPKEILENSLIVTLMRRKAFFYLCGWIAFNFAIGIAIKVSSSAAIISYGVQFSSILIIWFIASADLSRYDISLLSAVIKAWREGKDLDSCLMKG